MTHPDDGGNGMKVIEGMIIGRRSMGRKLAFADIAILPSSSSASSSSSPPSGEESSLSKEIEAKNGLIKIKFVRQSFLGPNNEFDTEKNDDNNLKEAHSLLQTYESQQQYHPHLNEEFPTKNSSLPFGATICAQLGRCTQKVLPTIKNNNGVSNGNGTECTTQTVWEVTRWKIKHHPRDLANQLASLETKNVSSTRVEVRPSFEDLESISAATANIEISSENGCSGKESISSSAPMHQTLQQQQQVIVGSGAMSCSTYLKVRREAFQLANEHKSLLGGTRMDNDESFRGLSNTPADGGEGNDGNGDVSISTSNYHVIANYATTSSTAPVTLNTIKATISSKTDSPLSQENTNASSSNQNQNGIEFDLHHGGKHAKTLRSRIFASWVLETFFGISIPGKFQTSHDGEEKFCQPCSGDNDTKISPDNSIEKNVHVLDVAGGKGQLSLELILQQMEFASTSPPLSTNPGEQVDGAKSENNTTLISKCTIIDPMVRKGDAKQRQMKLKRAKSRAVWLKKQKTEESIKEGRERSYEQQQQQQQQQQFNFEENHDGNTKLNVQITTQQPLDSDASSKTNTRNDNTGPIITHLATCFEFQTFPALHSQFIDPDKQSIYQSSSTNDSPPQTSSPLNQQNRHLNLSQQQQSNRLLLLGLHPDQPTEDILDIALKYNLSVAIVPCCVFPDLFPSRRMRRRRDVRTGTTAMKERNNNDIFGTENDTENHSPNIREEDESAVRNYSDFIQYLMDKDDCLQIAKLPFEGKNVVIYKKTF